MAAQALWPTPTVTSLWNRAGISAKSGDGLSTAVQRWPTPASRDFRHPNALSFAERGGETKGEQLPNAIGGPLNPDWVEWLMGFPIGWTRSLAGVSSRKACRASRVASPSASGD